MWLLSIPLVPQTGILPTLAANFFPQYLQNRAGQNGRKFQQKLFWQLRFSRHSGVWKAAFCLFCGGNLKKYVWQPPTGKFLFPCPHALIQGISKNAKRKQKFPVFFSEYSLLSRKQATKKQQIFSDLLLMFRCGTVLFSCK